MLLAVASVFALEGCVYAPAVPKELYMQAPNPPRNSRPPVPETVGATSGPIPLGKSVSTIHFEVHAPTGPALLRTEGPPKRVLLRVENVRSNMPAPSFDVYLNVPPGEAPEAHPDLHALTISTFGLVERSKPQGGHPGNGLSFVQDVTDIYNHLTAGANWDGKDLRVSFVPAPSASYPVEVTVSRVSLLIE